jgi:3-dehydroquinate synthase
VDSSIGGKTGVDFDAYKNMIGAFHMPKLVYINVATLSTLDDIQFTSGMGEIIKHSLIKDREYFDWISEHREDILNRDADTLTEMIKVSCNIKRLVVEKDPTEKGDRALLNFGHTLGHAIERYLNLEESHGACVGMGCCLAARISYNEKEISAHDLQLIEEIFDYFNFPKVSDKDIDCEKVLEYTKNDKKMVGDKIKFILLHSIGDAYINTEVTLDDMRRSFKAL